MRFCVMDSECAGYDHSLKLPGTVFSGALCEGCRLRSESELRMLRFDYVDLSQLIPKAQGFSDSKISRPKPESAPPIDVGVYTMRSEIAYTMALIELAVRRHVAKANVPAPWRPAREGYTLDRSLLFLDPRVDTIACLPPTSAHWDMLSDQRQVLDGPAMLSLIGALHRRARRACGLEPRTITVPGVCPQCSVPSLRRADDNPQRIWCVHCRLSMSDEEYHRSQRHLYTRTSDYP